MSYACSDETNDTGDTRDPRPWFSFFATSQSGLLKLADDAERGFGGDLGGLDGADSICSQLAEAASPDDRKVWRAFLSSSGLVGERVDAIDRIGEGPWYDYHARLFSQDIEGLLAGDDGRPAGDPQLAEMFTDEHGDPIRPSELTDNHDMLTGSGPDGRLFDDGAEGRVATCNDWTDATLRGPASDFMGRGGQVPVGHAWPRSARNGRNWISDHTVNGCEPGIDISGSGAAPSDDFSVGAGGGYGGFYCFALDAALP